MKIFKLTLAFLFLFTTFVYADFDPPTENYTPDGFDVLLIHGDQADGTAGTDIIDSADSKTITAVGSAEIDTAFHAFASDSGSVLFVYDDGGFLRLADSADWDFGTGNFTIDFWVRYSTMHTNAVHGLFGQFVDNSNRVFLWLSLSWDWQLVLATSFHIKDKYPRLLQ